MLTRDAHGSLKSPACLCASITAPNSSHDIPCRAGSVYNDVINHTRIACVHVINMHATAGSDRGLDDFARLVHNVTGPVENITARSIRSVHENNERFG